ncbi:MAG: KilA-N domain-containing protein [Planctomycetes bacterium]|nr:KilA-N domain-containing protein [Planctomycetota bacterium]
MAKSSKITVLGNEITVVSRDAGDFISLTDMIRAKDGNYFVSDWLRNRNTIEFLGIWEKVYNPDFNYVEFDVIKSHAVLNAIASN